MFSQMIIINFAYLLHFDNKYRGTSIRCPNLRRSLPLLTKTPLSCSMSLYVVRVLMRRQQLQLRYPYWFWYSLHNLQQFLLVIFFPQFRWTFDKSFGCNLAGRRVVLMLPQLRDGRFSVGGGCCEDRACLERYYNDKENDSKVFLIFYYHISENNILCLRWS